MDEIPFNRPFIVGKELYYIAQAVMSGKIAGDGLFTERCHKWMESRFGAKKVLLTHSCTAALEMAALLADIQPGDEVVMPSFTFVSTANAFALRGAHIRFVEIRTDTLNVDETKVEEALSKRTKAIVPVHYAGIGCEMSTIVDIAQRHQVLVIEDAAQGVSATYEGHYLGTIGHLGAYSFHETKNFIAGEGGALVINDERFIERAEVIREKGTDRTRFFRGEVDKYSWVDLGSSYLPSEIVAAFLYAQLEAIDEIMTKRRSVYQRYLDAFTPLAREGLVQIPTWPAKCQHNAHLFYLILPSRESRDGFIAHLRSQGVHSVFHYVPLHSSPMGRKMGYAYGDFPITEDLSSRLVRMPFYYDLDEPSQAHILDVACKWLRQNCT